MQLTDGVIRLRRFRPDDASAVTAACNDPESVRFIPGMPTPYTEDDADAYLRRCDRVWEAGEHRPFAIVDAGDELLGAIEVRVREIGSIGYWVAAGARNRGVATRALTLLSRWALIEGGVERLELITHPENLASQRVAEKAGFTYEGVRRSRMRFRDGRRDSVLFALLPGDL